MSPSQKLLSLDIVLATCAQYDITPTEIESHERPARIAWPRMVAIYLIRHHTGAIWREISALFHLQQSTAPHAFQSVRDRLTVDPEFAKQIAQLETTLNLKPSRGAGILPALASR